MVVENFAVLDGRWAGPQQTGAAFGYAAHVPKARLHLAGSALPFEAFVLHDSFRQAFHHWCCLPEMLL